MSLTTLGFLIISLSLYSLLLVRRAAYIQRYVLLPFIDKIYSPNAMKVFNEDKREELASKVDIYNFRILSCFVTAILATLISALYILLVKYEGNVQTAGAILAVLFGYLVANFNLNTTIQSWVRSVENKLLSRVIIENADEGGFDSVSDYLGDEDKKLRADYYDKMVEVADDFDQAMIDEGYDPEKNYESDEDYAEFLKILERVTEKMNEKYPEVPDK